VLPGNHETHEQTRALCERFGFVDFHRRMRRLGATNWAGLGYSNPTPFNTPGEYTVGRGGHAGSRVLREWVKRVQPTYLFCGHIHECAGRSDRIGATQCFNVGKAGHLIELP
jgi:Icc-related predicted phosphoesterase